MRGGSAGEGGIPADEQPAARPARFGPWRREVRAFLEFFALTGIAVAQPTFDILSSNSSIFVTRGTTQAEVIGLVLVLVLAPAVGLWLVEAISGAVFPRARRWIHVVLAAIVVGVIAVEAFKKQTELGPWPLVVIAVAAAVLGGWLLLRFAVVGLWLRYLSIAPVIFAVLFVFFSPVTSVIFEPDAQLARVKVGQPNRVVMIVFDELPVESLLDGSGQVDSSLFPNFAALSQQATWYRNTTTVSQYTTYAVPAILSGDFPTSATGEPGAAENQRNLFTLLGRTYDMNVHESLTRLCPASLCGLNRQAAAGVHPGFRGLLFDSFELWRDFAGLERPPETVSYGSVRIVGDDHSLSTLRRFVRSLQPTREPRVDFLHVLLPHVPWHYLPTGQDYSEFETVRGFVGYTTWQNDWAAQLARQRHLLQLMATDQLLGQVVAKLKRIGAYDDSLLVVTADHGLAFTGGQPMRGISEQNQDQVVRPPLLIKAPGEAQGGADDRPASTIDILPTLADHLDVKVPWKVDGRSLLGRPARDGPRRIFDWGFNKISPPPGSPYITVPGPAGFDAAMRGRASDATGDPSLRLYKIGRYGDLLGRSAGPLVRPGSQGATGSLADAERFRNVDPTARRAPFAYIEGSIEGAEPNVPLAIALNGTIAGFSATVPDFWNTKQISFWGMLPPQLFRRGRNDVALYLIRGSPDAPELEPVRLEG